MHFFQLRKYLTVRDKRPKNLNLLTIRFPLPAIVSILHRVSGVVLFLFIPMLLWVLDFSLASQDNFYSLRQSAATPLVKIMIWLCLSPFIYHFVAGIRHLLMDVNLGVELKSGRITSILTFIVTFILLVLAGIYLW